MKSLYVLELLVIFAGFAYLMIAKPTNKIWWAFGVLVVGVVAMLLTKQVWG